MAQQPSNTLKKIVIIGGGFAGLNLAKKLVKDKRYAITLVDKNNYHFFPPLLYQVATGFLETSSICYPFRKFFRYHQNLQFRLGECVAVDPASHTCYLDTGSVAYDYLVFAVGSVVNFYAIPNVENWAVPMKTVNDALHMRNHLLQSLEQASISTCLIEKMRLLTIVVVGGGPTGVEVAGVLAELRKNMLARDYPELLDVPAEIYLIDSAPDLLMHMSDKSQAEAYSGLRKLGVQIKLNTRVTGYENAEVIFSDGGAIETRNLIWAAGVTGKRTIGIPATSFGTSNRMITDAYHQVKDLEHIYAIGDTSIDRSDRRYPNGHAQLAQVAIQQGINLARNFSNSASGKSLNLFRYRDEGTLAIIGRSKAVADLILGRRFHVGGFIALLIWLFVHIMGLVSWANKLRTCINWIVAYATGDQSLRMIVRPAKEQPDSFIKTYQPH